MGDFSEKYAVNNNQIEACYQESRKWGELAHFYGKKQMELVARWVKENCKECRFSHPKTGNCSSKRDRRMDSVAMNQLEKGNNECEFFGE
jgi:hypothetical protein